MLNNLITVENIQSWYKAGNWTDLMVQKAIELGYITNEDFENIKSNIEAENQAIADAQKAEADRIAQEKAEEEKRRAELQKQLEEEQALNTDTAGEVNQEG